ncbi:MAG: hypothetical protein ACP5KA_01170 [Desulfurococcaceae archaeon]
MGPSRNSSRKVAFLAEEELEYIKKGIERRIQVEAEMIEKAKKLFETSEEPCFKIVLAAISGDEKKHHALLLDIYDKTAVKEKFSEEEPWDAVWRDRPRHGAPGG